MKHYDHDTITLLVNNELVHFTQQTNGRWLNGTTGKGVDYYDLLNLIGLIPTDDPRDHIWTALIIYINNAAEKYCYSIATAGTLLRIHDAVEEIDYFLGHQKDLWKFSIKLNETNQLAEYTTMDLVNLLEKSTQPDISWALTQTGPLNVASPLNSTNYKCKVSTRNPYRCTKFVIQPDTHHIHLFNGTPQICKLIVPKNSTIEIPNVLVMSDNGYCVSFSKKWSKHIDFCHYIPVGSIIIRPDGTQFITQEVYPFKFKFPYDISLSLMEPEMAYIELNSTLSLDPTLFGSKDQFHFDYPNGNFLARYY